MALSEEHVVEREDPGMSREPLRRRERAGGEDLPATGDVAQADGLE